MIIANGSDKDVEVNIDGTVIVLSFAEAVELMGELDEALARSDSLRGEVWTPDVGERCYPWRQTDVVGEIAHIRDGWAFVVFDDDSPAVVDVDELRAVSVRRIEKD